MFTAIVLLSPGRGNRTASALSAMSQPFAQLHCLFVTPRHLSSTWQGLSPWPDTLDSPPHHEARGKPFSISIRARTDTAPHPGWLIPCGAPGPDPPARLTKKDALPEEFCNTVPNSTPITGFSLSARGPEESQLAAHSLKDLSTRPHPRERERGSNKFSWFQLPIMMHLGKTETPSIIQACNCPSACSALALHRPTALLIHRRFLVSLNYLKNK